MAGTVTILKPQYGCGASSLTGKRTLGPVTQLSPLSAIFDRRGNTKDLACAGRCNVIWQNIQREVDYRWRLKGLSRLHHHLPLRLRPHPQSPTPRISLELGDSVRMAQEWYLSGR